MTLFINTIYLLAVIFTLYKKLYILAIIALITCLVSNLYEFNIIAKNKVIITIISILIYSAALLFSEGYKSAICTTSFAIVLLVDIIEDKFYKAVLLISAMFVLQLIK